MLPGNGAGVIVVKLVGIGRHQYGITEGQIMKE